MYSLWPRNVLLSQNWAPELLRWSILQHSQISTLQLWILLGWIISKCKFRCAVQQSNKYFTSIMAIYFTVCGMANIALTLSIFSVIFILLRGLYIWGVAIIFFKLVYVCACVHAHVFVHTLCACVCAWGMGRVSYHSISCKTMSRSAISLCCSYPLVCILISIVLCIFL